MAKLEEFEQPQNPNLDYCEHCRKEIKDGEAVVEVISTVGIYKVNPANQAYSIEAKDNIIKFIHVDCNKAWRE